MNTQKCLTDTDLGRLLDKDLTPQEQQTFQHHIDGCPACQARWQRISGGARHVEALLAKAASQARQSRACLSDEMLTGYAGDTLDAADRRMAEEHLFECPRCREALADRFTESFATDGDAMWSEYVADQVLRLFAKIPERIDSLLEILEGTREQPPASPQTITLPLFEPADSEARRLAAATGEGLSEQVVRQLEPPFEIHLVQFGHQVRIGVRAMGEDSTYDNCLGRLELGETEAFEHSRVVLIDKGQGQCILDQADISALRPPNERPGVRFVPIVTLAELTAVGEKAYEPMLVQLLHHEDPKIRNPVIEVVARIYGPRARPMIMPLTEDKDESVRLTARKALARFPQL